ncbi:unnamed protein product [Prunus armeniaca]|uniref:Gnk2-homologous domain-containing protein n=1 Tax=Prunus armeniaca TaxID=36596 RepID=A0A6J5UCX7_PRUAR|nr:unnamed protein product [Prunus armeniaca]CAB4304734.1 unnamed protein product [Prunus armeniaca]
MKPFYPTGFALGSKGTHDTERAYGLTLCSVGVSALVCAACISDAILTISSNIVHIVKLQLCCTKIVYISIRTNKHFFGPVVENQTKVCVMNQQNTSNPTSFIRMKVGLFSNLVVGAANTTKLEATECLEPVEVYERIHASVQCPSDLCTTCLHNEILFFESRG